MAALLPVTALPPQSPPGTPMATSVHPASHHNPRWVAGSSCTWDCHPLEAPLGAAAPPVHGHSAAVPAPEQVRPAVTGAAGWADAFGRDTWMVPRDLSLPGVLSLPHGCVDPAAPLSKPPGLGWLLDPGLVSQRAFTQGPRIRSTSHSSPTAALEGPLSGPLCWSLPFCSWLAHCTCILARLWVIQR